MSYHLEAVWSCFWEVETAGVVLLWELGGPGPQPQFYHIILLFNKYLNACIIQISYVLLYVGPC